MVKHSKSKRNKVVVQHPSILPRPEMLVSLLVENYGRRGVKKRSLGSIMLEAGYSPESARNPKKIFQTQAVQEALTPFLQKLKSKRDMALSYITEKKLNKSNAQQSAYVFDVLTKNTELLSGKPTERIDTLSDKEKKQLDELLAEAHEK